MTYPIKLKAVDSIAPIHKAQIMTYLKLSGCKLGLLLNFKVVNRKAGITNYYVTRLFYATLCPLWLKKSTTE